MSKIFRYTLIIGVVLILVVIIVVLLAVLLPDRDNKNVSYAPIVTLTNGAQDRGIVQSVDDGTIYLYQGIKFGE